MIRRTDILSFVGTRFVRKVRTAIFRNKCDLNLSFQMLNIIAAISLFTMYILNVTSKSIYIYLITMLITNLANISRIFLKIGYEIINRYGYYLAIQYICQVFMLYSLVYIENNNIDNVRIANILMICHIAMWNIYYFYSWYLRSCSYVNDEYINRELFIIASLMAHELENNNPHLTQQQIDTIPNISYDGTVHANINCSICQDAFDINTTIKQLPCNHLFHPECVATWLRINNTCPNCRYVIPNN